MRSAILEAVAYARRISRELAVAPRGEMFVALLYLGESASRLALPAPVFKRGILGAAANIDDMTISAKRVTSSAGDSKKAAWPWRTREAKALLWPISKAENIASWRVATHALEQPRHQGQLALAARRGVSSYQLMAAALLVKSARDAAPERKR